MNSFIYSYPTTQYFGKGAAKKAFDADSVVIAVGFRPVPSMAQELQGCGAAVYEIGDGQKVSTILHAVWDGYEVGNNI